MRGAYKRPRSNHQMPFLLCGSNSSPSAGREFQKVGFHSVTENNPIFRHVRYEFKRNIGYMCISAFEDSYVGASGHLFRSNEDSYSGGNADTGSGRSRTVLEFLLQSHLIPQKRIALWRFSLLGSSL